MKIEKSTFAFLKDLDKNNNRDWFNTNKKTYVDRHENMIDFAEALLEKMNVHDNIETPTGKKSMHRIYRDTRFAKDKTPYKRNFSGSYKRATKALRGGYYFHIEPGNTFIAGGFWGPNPDDLKRIRQDIDYSDKSLRKITSDSRFVEFFGELRGTGVKTAPKGYPKDHPAIDLLRKKQFVVMRPFTDKEVLSADFIEHANETFQAMRPFFDYMSEVLTTNANGESII